MFKSSFELESPIKEANVSEARGPEVAKEKKVTYYKATRWHFDESKFLLLCQMR